MFENRKHLKNIRFLCGFSIDQKYSFFSGFPVVVNPNQIVQLKDRS